MKKTSVLYKIAIGALLLTLAETQDLYSLPKQTSKTKKVEVSNKNKSSPKKNKNNLTTSKNKINSKKNPVKHLPRSSQIIIKVGGIKATIAPNHNLSSDFDYLLALSGFEADFSQATTLTAPLRYSIHFVGKASVSKERSFELKNHPIFKSITFARVRDGFSVILPIREELNLDSKWDQIKQTLFITNLSKNRSEFSDPAATTTHQPKPTLPKEDLQSAKFGETSIITARRLHLEIEKTDPIRNSEEKLDKISTTQTVLDEDKQNIAKLPISNIEDFVDQKTNPQKSHKLTSETFEKNNYQKEKLPDQIIQNKKINKIAPTRALTKIDFEYSKENKPIVKLYFNSKPSFSLSKLDQETYRLQIDNFDLAEEHLALPYFPPSDFIGLTTVLAEPLSTPDRGLQIRIGIDRGTNIQAIPKENMIIITFAK
ncbi:MAG TPA: hypothetical protein PKD37_02140 [Oligoflexia bacterium]|nr:hypothetical protein [Oligoflexia bacterium]HMP26771.1 hypothetical protein [Oligoflexia bacterium]